MSLKYTFTLLDKYSASLMKNHFVSKERSDSNWKNWKVNLVLIKKDRHKSFTSHMLDRLYIIIEELLGKCDCKLVDFNGEDDHIHCLFQYHQDVELFELVNNLKLASSKKLGQEFSEDLANFYWEEVFLLTH